MFSIIQILLIGIIMTFIGYDLVNLQTFGKGPGLVVLSGFFTGLIMGDVKVGLLVGGTMELIGLGIAGFGGASVPNYRVGASVGTAFAIATGSGLETALVIGIPTATLGVQLDVFAKMIGSFWLHRAERAVEEGNYKKCYRIIFWGNMLTGRPALTHTYPVVLFLVLGSTFVEDLVTMIPSWLTTALTATGSVLPALGMAILLKFLPVKQNIQYLILGFILAVYFKLSILPIALVGLVIAIVLYKYNVDKISFDRNNEGGLGDE